MGPRWREFIFPNVGVDGVCKLVHTWEREIISTAVYLMTSSDTRSNDQCLCVRLISSSVLKLDVPQLC